MGVAVRMAVLEALLDPRRTRVARMTTTVLQNPASSTRRAISTKSAPSSSRTARSPPAAARRTRARPRAPKSVDCRGLIAAPGLVDAASSPASRARAPRDDRLGLARGGGRRRHHLHHDAGHRSRHRRYRAGRIRAEDGPRQGLVNIYPAAAITKGLAGEEMTEFGLLQEAGAVAFTNGRNPMHNAQVLRRA
jgi:dihydroorotase